MSAAIWCVRGLLLTCLVIGSAACASAMTPSAEPRAHQELTTAVLELGEGQTDSLHGDIESRPSAADVIERFYRAYLPLLGEPTSARPALPYSIEFTQMVRRNLELCERLADGICGFGTDGDPYLDGQEFEVPLNFDSAKVQILEGRPGWVEVSLNIYPSAEDRFYDRRIAYQMIRQADTWVVDDIFYSGVSVRQRIDKENAELLGAER